MKTVYCIVLPGTTIKGIYNIPCLREGRVNTTFQEDFHFEKIKIQDILAPKSKNVCSLEK